MNTSPIQSGFIPSVVEDDHYIFGGGQLGDSPINPSGQWHDWLPDPEIQNVNSVEPQACVSFATLNCLESLLRIEFSRFPNYSDRYLAWASGTQYKAGNDPQTVCETLRKGGDVLEAAWQIDGSVKDFKSFYAQPPMTLKTLALNFIDEFEYGHEWVPNTPEAMMKALTYSPLSAGVYAWQIDPATGLYTRPKGAVSEHDIMISGYDEINHKYWKIFDSYSPEEKMLEWDFSFDGIKRHTLHRQIVDEWAFTKFLKLIRKILGV